MAENRYAAYVTYNEPDSMWSSGSCITYAHGQTPEHAKKKLIRNYEKSGKQVTNCLVQEASGIIFTTGGDVRYA